MSLDSPPLRPQPTPLRLRVPHSKPVWTYIILTVNLLFFGGTLLLGRRIVLGLGAKVNSAIVAGQVWRLFTSMFLHVDVLHIGFNSYALFIFGQQVERPYGPVRFPLIYLLSGLAGSALSFLLSPAPAVGASGAIFGLIGVTGAYLYRYRDFIVSGRSRLLNILSIAAYNLIYGFVVPNVDNWAHIGGLLAGLALGWFLAPRYQVMRTSLTGPPEVQDRSSTKQWLGGIGLVLLVIWLMLLGGLVRWGG